MNTIDRPRIVLREEWIEARTALREKEKAHARAHGALAADGHGQVFHSCACGVDILIGAHSRFYVTPKDRHERGTMGWVSHHDRYG